MMKNIKDSAGYKVNTFYKFAADPSTNWNREKQDNPKVEKGKTLSPKLR